MIGWRLEIPKFGIIFEADRLRRDRHELMGELIVRCALPGAKTVNGCLTTGDFNFSSVRARSDRAKMLETRARTNGDLDWFAYLEEFCQGVFEREREGEPAQDIWSIPPPEKSDDFSVDGLALPRRHPSILFGDGGSAKSYIALYIAGRLSLQGIPVALFDWELSGEEHRERFQLLFGAERPPLSYVRCEVALARDIERVARIVRDNKIVYAFFDSIAFACDDRPEDADTARRYFQALRALSIGSLHIAHINKSEDSERKPFGSIFWHNGARCTWFVQAAERTDDDSLLRLGFFNRKANLGPLHRPISMIVDFAPDRTLFNKADITDSAELAERMTIKQRMHYILKRGSMEMEELAEEMNVDIKTLRKTVSRHRNDFVLLAGGRVGLCARGA